MSASDNEWLSTEEVSALFRVKPSTVAHWRVTPGRKQPLKFHRFGGQIRYRRADVMAFIEAGCVDPHAATHANAK